jgi:hypothetical protein
MLLEELLAKSSILHSENGVYVLKKNKLQDKEDKKTGCLILKRKDNETILCFEIEKGNFAKNFKGKKIIDYILFMSIVKNKQSRNILIFIELKSENKDEVYKGKIKLIDFVKNLKVYYKEILKEDVIDYLQNKLNFKVFGLIIHASEDFKEKDEEYKKQSFGKISLGKYLKTQPEIREDDIKIIFCKISCIIRELNTLQNLSKIDDEFRKCLIIHRFLR